LLMPFQSKKRLVAVFMMSVVSLYTSGSAQDSPLTLTPAQRNTLERIRQQILVPGEVRSASVREIHNQLPGQTTVTELAADGQEVIKGDVIVRFDDAQARIRYEDQRVVTAQAQAGLRAAEIRLKEARESAEALIPVAERRVKIAELAQALALSDDGEIAEEVASASREIDLANKMMESTVPVSVEAAEAVHMREAATARKRLLETYIRPLEAARHEKEVLEARAELQTARTGLAAKLTVLQGEIDAKTIALESANSTLKKLQDQVEACVVVAPESGVVRYPISSRGSQTTAIGSQIRQGQLILTIEDTRKFVAYLKVSEVDVARLRPGQAVAVQVNALGDQVLDAEIKKIDRVPLPGNWMSGNTIDYGVTAEFTVPPENLRLGMTLSAEILSPMP
jgi:multidrug resistance efflux pump